MTKFKPLYIFTSLLFLITFLGCGSGSQTSLDKAKNFIDDRASEIDKAISDGTVSELVGEAEFSDDMIIVDEQTAEEKCIADGGVWTRGIRYVEVNETVDRDFAENVEIMRSGSDMRPVYYWFCDYPETPLTPQQICEANGGNWICEFSPDVIDHTTEEIEINTFKSYEETPSCSWQ
jgi:hypothetical protein